MRAVVQRVSGARVMSEGKESGKIGCGLMVLLGVGTEDTEDDARYIAKKIAELRIFEDAAGKLNLDVREVGGEVLLVSQFTLYGDARNGRRPGFTGAARPELATALYERVIELLRESGLNVETGVFQTHMSVELANDGPVTLLLESKKLF